MIPKCYGVKKSEFIVYSSVVKLKSIQSAITWTNQLAVRLKRALVTIICVGLREQTHQSFVVNRANGSMSISGVTLPGTGHILNNNFKI